jgi:acetoin utilization deacetylase AcuC-like enzyme
VAPLLTKVPVFYSEAMTAATKSFSPSAAKPRLVLESWKKLPVPINVIEPSPVGRDDLLRAHDPAFVDGVLSGIIPNGFGNTDKTVYSVSSVHERRDACRSPRGHEGRSGLPPLALRVGSRILYLQRPDGGSPRPASATRIGILDFDQHYGDGTNDIIGRLGIDWIVHYSAGTEFHNVSQAKDFLTRVPELVASMRGCDVVLYQAGADPHRDDPLGGWLDTEELAERDYRVFAAAEALGIPVAWNLAGGYQTPLRRVLDIHDNTLLACGRVYASRTDI